MNPGVTQETVHSLGVNFVCHMWRPFVAQLTFESADNPASPFRHSAMETNFRLAKHGMLHAIKPDCQEGKDQVTP